MDSVYTSYSYLTLMHDYEQLLNKNQELENELKETAKKNKELCKEMRKLTHQLTLEKNRRSKERKKFVSTIKSQAELISWLEWIIANDM